MNSQKTSNDELRRLIASMSLEEKIGQMTQLDLLTVSIPGTNPIQLDATRLHNALAVHHVGSFINNGANRALSIEEWHYVHTTIDAVIATTPHRIPLLYGIDSIHGATYVHGTTLFPHNIGFAASRNLELTRQACEISAMETRAAGLRWNFAPVLDVGRHPLWSRFPETFGEDVYLATVFGRTCIEGFQGSDVSNLTSVAACMKHFLGYSFPFNGKDRSPALIPENYLREYFLPPFREAVQAGVKTVMINSAEINGVPVHANRHLLTDVLRGELGFEGVVVSDWEDVIRLHTWHKRARTPEEAVQMTVNAGLDMSMVPSDFSFCEHLKKLVLDGKITLERIEESVLRILKLKRDLGLFQTSGIEPKARENFASPSYATIALQAAEESIILLKNKNSLLPLTKSAKLLVVGPTSNSISALHGCWSFTWQGRDTSQYPANSKSVLDCLQDHVGARNITHLPGCHFEGPVLDIAECVQSATDCDAIILCLGEDAYAETQGDINCLDLPNGQTELAKGLAAAGKPIILILLQGRCRVIRDIVPIADAILLTFWPGSQGARAIANTIFGESNPSGKMPCTYPRYSNHLVTYDRNTTTNLNEDMPPEGHNSDEYRPQFEFGEGIGYTSYSVSNLKLNSTRFFQSGLIELMVDVSNTGSRCGKETVEVFSKQLYASITPPLKRLRAFQKIQLNPLERRTVTFKIPVSDLAIVDEHNKTVVEPGDYELMVAGHRVALRVD